MSQHDPELIEAWPAYEAMIRRLPRGRSYAEEPAHTFRPARLSGRGHDVVSNVVRRTFPPGQSVECVRSAVFRALNAGDLTPDQREHVTKVFYDRPDDWRLRSVICAEPQWADVRMVVDHLDDLRALEAGVAQPPSFGDLAKPEPA